MKCKTCGEEMEGDGASSVLYCPNSTQVVSNNEPDANPIYCTFEPQFAQARGCPKIVGLVGPTKPAVAHATTNRQPSDADMVNIEKALAHVRPLETPIADSTMQEKALTAVGDIHSSEKGSGARYNAGKPDMSLIPLNYLVDIFKPTIENRNNLDWAVLAAGKFQMGGTKEDLLEAMQCLSSYVEECARVFEYGKKKYAAWNWAKGMAWSIPIACIGRHYLKVIGGEAADAESGLMHEAHIMCNVVMLLWYIENYPEGDDRFKGVK